MRNDTGHYEIHDDRVCGERDVPHSCQAEGSEPDGQCHAEADEECADCEIHLCFEHAQFTGADARLTNPEGTVLFYNIQLTLCPSCQRDRQTASTRIVNCGEDAI